MTLPTRGAVAGLLFITLGLTSPTLQSATGDTEIVTTPSGQRLQVETVAEDLEIIWDLAWAPDGQLWITERGGRVSRFDPTTDELTTVGEVPDVYIVRNRRGQERGPHGLLGMAFHPDFPAEPWVYFAHSVGSPGAVYQQLIRMRYEDGELGAREILVDNIATRSHAGSRLAVGSDRLLYYTMGDGGTGRNAQDLDLLTGKILRLTLEGAPAPRNPFGTLVWSLGHRNPQGLVFHPVTGLLYSTEHGPEASDEVNIIESGHNYGWPAVEGRCDTPEESRFCEANAVAESLFEWTPTVGVAGADFYMHDLIPEWNGNLLVSSLVGQSLWRITLTSDGRAATAVEQLFAGKYGRIRDVLVGPDGRVYIGTSNRTGARGVQPDGDDDRIFRISPAP